MAEKKIDLKCATCGDDSDMRCSLCRAVYYCSKECQKKHWPYHKNFCSTVTQAKNGKESEGRLCRHCKKYPEKLYACSGCKRTSYCSRECQKIDWKNGHKHECHYRSKSHADESNNPCVECGRQCDTKRCARCKTTFYCSVRCQKTHWPHHKLFCHKETVPKQAKPSSTTVSPICAYCRANDCSVSCESRKLVFYCSQNCQMKDLEKHKSICRKKSVRNKETLSEDLCTIMGLVTPEEHGGINSNEKKQFPDFQEIVESCGRGLHCNKCGKKDNVRPCKRCKSTMYCSTACESADNHEKICSCMQFWNSLPGHSVKRGLSDSGLYVTTVSNSPPHSWLSNKDPMLSEDGADLNLIIERSDEDRQKAIFCVKQKLSFQSLITRVREIPMEEMSISGSNICHIPNVFLAYIRRYHSYRGRHNVYLQDSERREIYASFYLPRDDPTPYFQWNQLVPGKFIAISYPCIHHFSDDSFGLRVDKAKHVTCFEI